MIIPLLGALLAQQPPGTDAAPIAGRSAIPHDLSAPAKSPDKRTSINWKGTSKPIGGIAFKGTKAPAAVAAAAEKFIGRPANQETLTELAGALSRAYEETDIALYTIAIPEQDFSDGLVEVLLSEGSIEDVRIEGKAGRSFPLLGARAGRLTGESPLSRSRYERQLSLMRAIPGLSVETGFDNPDGDDGLTLLLSPRQKRAKFGVGISNRGPDLVGDLLLNAGADFYRLLRDGDHLSFRTASSREFRRYRQASLSYAVPLGSDGLNLTASGGWIRSRAQTFDIRGNARLAGLSLSYPVLRGFDRSADLSIGIDGLNSDNAIFGNAIASEKTRAVRLGGGYASAGESHELSAQAIVSRGLDILGAQTNAPIAETKFTKVAGQASYTRKFSERLLGRATAVAQLSRDRLPASELFAAGGPSIGRAFDTALVTGDSGVGGLVELAFRPLRSSLFGQSEIYLFGDAAALKLNRRGAFANQRFDLASAGAGARLRLKDWMELGVEAAAVVDRPFGGYDSGHRLSFYYSLAL